MESIDHRNQSRQQWLSQQFSTFEMPTLLAGDASFRQYFRLRSGDQTYVLMDAPPTKESCEPFIAVANTFQQSGLLVPNIYAADLEQGFLLLSDFGDDQLLSCLDAQTVDPYYRIAFEDLLVLQQCRVVKEYELPQFDAALYQYEFDLFLDWYLQQHLKIKLSTADRTQLNELNQQLIDIALSQPQVLVHRDYHSRNLMVLPDQRLGILDFQDALWGPITYDLMSLIRDCYIEWSDEQVKNWCLYFQERLLAEGLLTKNNPEEFLLWCDAMALQRHLKCIGIFSRLCYRDNKPDYLKDIPRILGYIQSICHRHSNFKTLLARVMP